MGSGDSVVSSTIVYIGKVKSKEDREYDQLCVKERRIILAGQELAVFKNIPEFRKILLQLDNLLRDVREKRILLRQRLLKKGELHE